MRVYSRWLYFVLGLIIFSPIASAQNAPLSSGYAGNGVFVQALKANDARVVGQAVIAQTTFKVQNGTAPTKYYDRAVSFNKAQYGGKVKNFIKGNAGVLATVGITLAVGYFLDYVTGDLYAQQATPALNCPSGVWDFGGGIYQACTLAEVEAYGKKYILQSYKNNPSSYENPVIQGWAFSYQNQNTKFYTYNVRYSWGGQSYDACPTAPCEVYFTHAPAQTSVPAQPASLPQNDEALAQWYIDNATAPDALAKPFVNPYTGAIARDTTIAQAEKDLYNEIAPSLGKATSNANPVTPPALDQQKAPSYDVLPDTETGGDFSLEFPDFCSWASAVCAAIDWMQTPGDAPPNADFEMRDMISESDTQPVNYNSGLGSGTCPADRQFTVYGTSLNYSYQPICELADIARIFVIIFAYLSSIYIVMGVKR